MSDRFQALRDIAPKLNQLKEDSNARVHYELMSGALVWSDELPAWEHLEAGESNCLRGVWRYRTTLILRKPEEKYQAAWELLQTLCPHWPGFLPDRQKSDPAKIQFYEERSAKLLADWEALDEKYERQRPENTRQAGAAANVPNVS